MTLTTKPVPLDVESYPNYFLVCVGEKSFEARGKNAKVDLADDLLDALRGPTYGFNSNRYDLLMLRYMLNGATVAELNRLSHDIIGAGHKRKELYERYDLNCGWVRFEHIDLIEPAPSVFVSLKKYGARMHAPAIVDLPYPPDTELTPAQMDEVLKYCQVDLELTAMLFEQIKPRLELRVLTSQWLSQSTGTPQMDLRSKSDPQIAEAVLFAKIRNAAYPRSMPRIVRCTLPDFIQFSNPDLNDLVTKLRCHRFDINHNNGQVIPPHWLTPVEIGKGVYRPGVGGLHSSETCQSITPKSGEQLVDCDVTSYYPSIILGGNLYPEHLGKPFIHAYRELYTQRVKAKQAGEKTKADGFKIVLNGCFGKMGSPYSYLYAPDKLLSVTLTGQLCLLMLIEALELAGIEVVSANTDGVVSLIGKGCVRRYRGVLKRWEADTGFNLETTRYASLHSRDVNNYLAVKMDGDTKGKGVFAETGLMKDPSGQIVPTAVKNYLVKGTPLKTTINRCKDIREFIYVRNCTGGAMWKNCHIGKTVRWVYVIDGEPMYSVKRGNKVALSDGSLPVMELGPVPETLDRAKYLAQAQKLLGEVGHDI